RDGFELISKIECGLNLLWHGRCNGGVARLTRIVERKVNRAFAVRPTARAYRAAPGLSENRRRRREVLSVIGDVDAAGNHKRSPAQTVFASTRAPCAIRYSR